MIKLFINYKHFKVLCLSKHQFRHYWGRFIKKKELMIKLSITLILLWIFNLKIHKKLKDLFKVYIMVEVMIKWKIDPYIFYYY
jgi:hypothetical protein